MLLKPPVSQSDHIQGNKHAIIELVEYGDYQCPYCAKAYSIIKALREQFSMDLKFVFRNFPLSTIHPQAKLAAIAAEAAGRQARFWQMHDFLFENQQVLAFENIFLFAKGIGLDTHRFNNDIHQNSVVKKVEADFESGVRSGVNGTPTFFINDEKYNGNWQQEPFSAYIKYKIDALKQGQAVIL